MRTDALAVDPMWAARGIRRYAPAPDPTGGRGFSRSGQRPTWASPRLLDLLAPRLAIARGYRFRHWIDDWIAVGERWTDAIGAALTGCDFGLLKL